MTKIAFSWHHREGGCRTRLQIKPQTHEKTRACQETSPASDRPGKDQGQCVLRMKVIQPACDESDY